MKFLEILLEDRFEEFKNKYSNKFSADLIDRLVRVPSKYLNWVGKVADPISISNELPDLFFSISTLN